MYNIMTGRRKPPLPNPYSRVRRRMSTAVTCHRYATCEDVPCGQVQNGCRPQYCIDPATTEGSKNWAGCNMTQSAWCRDETRCLHYKRLSRRLRERRRRYTVDAEVMHRKMPYIWRYLDKKTRKKMIRLAKEPIYRINT